MENEQEVLLHVMYMIINKKYSLYGNLKIKRSKQKLRNTTIQETLLRTTVDITQKYEGDLEQRKSLSNAKLCIKKQKNKIKKLKAKQSEFAKG